VALLGRIRAWNYSVERPHALQWVVRRGGSESTPECVNWANPTRVIQSGDGSLGSSLGFAGRGSAYSGETAAGLRPPRLQAVDHSTGPRLQGRFTGGLRGLMPVWVGSSLDAETQARAIPKFDAPPLTAE
jgi:hypothetical protein